MSLFFFLIGGRDPLVRRCSLVSFLLQRMFAGISEECLSLLANDIACIVNNYENTKGKSPNLDLHIYCSSMYQVSNTYYNNSNAMICSFFFSMNILTWITLGKHLKEDKMSFFFFNK